MKKVKQAVLVLLVFSLIILSFVLASQVMEGIGGWLEPVGTILLGSIGGGVAIALVTKLENGHVDHPKSRNSK